MPVARTGAAIAAFALVLALAGVARAQYRPISKDTAYRASARGAIGVMAAPYNARCDGTTNDTRAIQSALDAAAPGTVVRLPRGRCHVTTLRLIKGVTLTGVGWDINGTGAGSTLVGTAGDPVLVFPCGPSGTANSPFAIEDLAITGGSIGISAPACANFTTTYVTLKNLSISSMTTAGIDIAHNVEEWYADQLYITGDGTGLLQTGTSYIQKSSFSNITFNGSGTNCMDLAAGAANSPDMADVFENIICQTSRQSGIVFRGPADGDIFINITTEANGMSGKNGATTASMTAGSNTVTLASATTWANGDEATIRGAARYGQDLYGYVCGLRGTTFSLDTTRACRAAQNASYTVSGVMATNAIYDDVTFANATGSQENMTFLNYGSGGNGDHNGIRYAVNSPPPNSVFIDCITGGAPSPDYVYDPWGASFVWGGGVQYQRNHIAMAGLAPGASFPHDSSPAYIGSPLGQDIDLGLIDTNGNGTGTYGEFRIRNSNGNRQTVLTVDSSGDMMATGTISGATLANRCSGIVRLSRGSGTLINSCITGSRPVLCTDNTSTSGAAVSCVPSPGRVAIHGTGGDAIAVAQF